MKRIYRKHYLLKEVFSSTEIYMQTELLTHHCDLKRTIPKIFGLSNNLRLSDACANVIYSLIFYHYPNL